MRPDARDTSGLAAGAARRRAEEGARAWGVLAPSAVIASGGRHWEGWVEADAFAAALERLGVPAGAIVRERASMTTRDNARYVAAICARRGVSRVAIVTCDWHMERAAALFAREGLEVTRVPAAAPRGTALTRAWRWGREAALGAMIALGAAGCARSGAGGPGGDAGVSGAPAGLVGSDFARAEDHRRAKEVTALLAAKDPRDVEARRRAAEAFARIADADAMEGLLRALVDEDPTTVAWGAYGLGRACKGNDAKIVPALVARATSFDVGAPAYRASDARDAVDPRASIARALGRCGGADAERTLAAWVKKKDAWSEDAALALGDVAAHGGLADETVRALVAAATGAPPLASALYPFARMERVPDASAEKVRAAALGSMGAPGLTRAFAVRALGRTGPAAVPDLARIVRDRSFSAAERSDAAYGLKKLGDDGHAAAADALAALAPSKDPFAIGRLAEDDYGVLTALAGALGAGELPKKSEASLFSIASLEAPGSPPPTLARRVDELRCAAAVALSKGGYDSEVLTKCAPAGDPIAESARLASLVKRPLVGDRKAAWRALTKSAHLRVREAAIDAIEQHPELGDLSRVALAEALADPECGLVATAAGVIQAHPERVLVLADSEKRAALDPNAPPPSTSPAKSIDPRVVAALAGAMKHAWPEDRVETRTGLLDAAAALGADGARVAAEQACKDPNVTIRDDAARALRVLGVTGATCPLPPDADAGAPPELDAPIGHATRVVFSTDAGDLSIAFDPVLSPVAATRFVALARAHFFDGNVVHRVVPGFVVQFGDPGGDGYGGAGRPLRCETSPVPFDALDVGVALAGKDTGSSQIFVMLGRAPHLDGEYARVGRAEGDWARVAEGDVVRSAKVEE